MSTCDENIFHFEQIPYMPFINCRFQVSIAQGLTSNIHLY